MPLSWLFWVLAAFSATQAAVAQPASVSKENTAKSTQSSSEYPIDINHSDVKHLMNIKGIGEKRAKAIIQYRKAHGDFKSVGDLAQVKGITKKRLQTLISKNQGKITVH
ncbi:MAG: helix-hairpin-helix domain-containing protein [Gammaproteobacteria bacterium]|nr:helix-hairpin-helix domain-containing protein [Gammaproteobacteria bacterium]